jgi:hypothetical protein
MHTLQNDIPWISWAVAGTAQSGILCVGDAAGRWIELIDKYEIYSETPFHWYRPENETAWLGHTITLCGTHAIDWSAADRTPGCESLTRLLQAVAASTLPLEGTGCRHELGSCVTRLAKISTGPVCQHSLAVEVSHQLSTIRCQRQREDECLEQLEVQLLLSGVPQARSNQ